VCGGVFQRTELLLYVFSIAITFHMLKYTQRAVKGHWEANDRLTRCCRRGEVSGMEAGRRITECSDCGGTVSLKAKSCPHCGSPEPFGEGLETSSTRSKTKTGNPTAPGLQITCSSCTKKSNAPWSINQEKHQCPECKELFSPNVYQKLRLHLPISAPTSEQIQKPQKANNQDLKSVTDETKTENHVGKCFDCGGAITKQENICPHCGCFSPLQVGQQHEPVAPAEKRSNHVQPNASNETTTSFGKYFMVLIIGIGLLFGTYKILNRSSEEAARRFEESTINYHNSLRQKEFDLENLVRLQSWLAYRDKYDAISGEEIEDLQRRLNEAVATGALGPDEANALQRILNNLDYHKARLLIDHKIRIIRSNSDDIDQSKDALKKFVDDALSIQNN
jgi:hypothetical protein